MYSVKPGRGPSLMGGIIGIVVAVGGIFWTVMASSMGAPAFFSIFGILFVIVAIAMVVYHFASATQQNRFSTFDITTPGEEADPLNRWVENRTSSPQVKVQSSTGQSDNPRQFDGDYCPYCGTKVESTFDYCPNCGKDI